MPGSAAHRHRPWFLIKATTASPSTFLKTADTETGSTVADVDREIQSFTIF